MKTLQALLWLDSRLVRRDWLAMAALGLVMPAVIAFAYAPAAADVALSFFFAPLAGALLGCTLGTRDFSPDFLESRAIGWARVVALRLAHRALLAAALVLLTRGALDLAWDLDPVLGSVREVGLAWSLLSASAAASRFVKQALSAIPTGAAALLLGCSAFGKLISVPAPLVLLHPATGVYCLLVAGAVLVSRHAPSRKQKRRLAILLPVALLLACVIGIGSFELIVRMKIQEARAAWAWADAPPPRDRNGDGLYLATRPVFVEAGLSVKRPPAKPSPPAVSYPPWLREAGQRLRHELRAESLGNVSLLSTAALGRALGGAEADIDRVESVLSAREDLDRIAEALGYQRTRDVLSMLIGDAVLSQARGDATRAGRLSGLAGRLIAGKVEGDAWAPLDSTLLLLTELDLAREHRGVAVPLAVLEQLAAVDFRRALADVAVVGFEADIAMFTSHPRTLPWRYGHASEHAAMGRELGRLVAEGRCGRSDELARLESEAEYRHLPYWQAAENMDISADLRLLVAAKRAGVIVTLEPPCADSRWVHEDHADGSWTIRLEDGPAWRHDEPAPSDIQRE